MKSAFWIFQTLCDLQKALRWHFIQAGCKIASQCENCGIDSPCMGRWTIPSNINFQGIFRDQIITILLFQCCLSCLQLRTNACCIYHELHILCEAQAGTRFNIKMISYQYRKSHCGDKTILRPSYLHNGISYTGKTTSLYWIRAQICIG